MSEPEKLSKDKFRIIIYHGHIHLLSTSKDIDDSENYEEIQNFDF
jgi:hypothetical protein